MRKIVCLRVSSYLLLMAGLLLVASPASATTLTIAHYEDYKPYAYVDQNGRSQGMLWISGDSGQTSARRR